MFTHDEIGNLLTWASQRDWTFTWKDGRRLAMAASGTTSVSYNYDAEGLRTSKTVGGTTYNYTYLGDKLVRQTWGDNVMDFSYDEQGRPFAVTYNGVTYHYILNVQGDVVAIAGNAGGIWARYTYNAWGELIGSYVSPSGDVGTVNPLRYRGYVYDSESGLYYLNSRYYDPGNRRYLNEDIYLSTGTGIAGYDMFAYCNNNPVLLCDPSGYVAGIDDVLLLVGGLLAIGIYGLTLYHKNMSAGQSNVNDMVSHVTGTYTKANDGINSVVSFKQSKGKNKAKRKAQGKELPPVPDVKYPGDNPTVKPGDDYTWKGKLPEGGDKGTWKNPNTGEQWHPDLDHPGNVEPHWDYTDPSGNRWRVFPDGTIELK